MIRNHQLTGTGNPLSQGVRQRSLFGALLFLFQTMLVRSGKIQRMDARIVTAMPLPEQDERFADEPHQHLLRLPFIHTIFHESITTRWQPDFLRDYHCASLTGISRRASSCLSLPKEKPVPFECAGVLFPIMFSS